jgi:hypothetical protein
MGRVPRVIWLSTMTVGLAIVVLVPVARGDTDGLLWNLTHVDPILAVALVASTRRGAQGAAAAVSAYAVLLVGLAWIVGFNPWTHDRKCPSPGTLPRS